MPSSRRDAHFLNDTQRYVSPGAEEALFVSRDLHGSSRVELVDYIGGDGLALYAATAGKGLDVFDGEVSPVDVFGHLRSQGIVAPFSFPRLKFHIQGPIAVALSFVYE